LPELWATGLAVGDSSVTAGFSMAVATTPAVDKADISELSVVAVSRVIVRAATVSAASSPSAISSVVTVKSTATLESEGEREKEREEEKIEFCLLLILVQS
jgi:hypothetical protein